MLSPKHTRLLLRLALGAIVLAVLTHTRADPDLFGHVRFGQDLVTARSVHLTDSYSFTSDRPWINHEWMSEATMYLAYAAGGTVGLIALKIVLLVVMLAAVILTLERYGLPPAPQDFLVALAVIGTFPQANHVRPQLFSLALFAWLLAVLAASRTRRLALIWTIPLMALWVDLHGGWLVAVGALAAWNGAGLLVARTRRDAVVGMTIAAASLIVTLFNPYGWRMWSFLHDTVGFSRAEITDWQPVFALGPAYGALWMLIAAAAVTGIARSILKRELELPAVAVVILFAAASLRVGRLLSFFTLSTVMLLGPQIAAAIGRLSARRAERVPSRLASAAAVAVALAIVAGGVTASAKNVACIRMEESMFAEPAVARVVSEGGVRGRMLTWFDWGEYAIWHFSPDVSVSIDGRRETVYSDAAIQQQLRFYRSPEDRAAILDTLRPDYIWLPSNLAVTPRLIADGWQPLFAGPRSTLLGSATRPGRDASSIPTTLHGDGGAASGSGAPRCFPGP